MKLVETESALDRIEADAAEIRIRAERRLGELLAELGNGAQWEPLSETKAGWIRDARRTFHPSPRTPCVVCGKYQSLVHAHHIIPLGVQYGRGAATPNHAHAWLCPTHHAAVHFLISRMADNAPPPGAAQFQFANDVAEPEFESLLAIARGWKG